MSIKWDEMPEWADVWIEDKRTPGDSGWHKECDTRFADKSGFYYEKLNMDSSKTVYYPPKETKPKWNGEGLPPVGTVCKMWHPGIDGYGWQKVNIICYFDDKVVIKGSPLIWEHGSSIIHIDVELKFKPIKSNKEKWVDQALKIASRSAPECDVTFSNAIYDALISGELPIPKSANND